MSTPHKIKLKQGSLRILRDVVSAVGWAKTTALIIIGGSLAARLPEVDALPDAKASQDEVKAWLNKDIPEFEVSEKERDAVKTALTHFSNEGGIPPTQHAAALLAAFGFE